MQHTFDRKTAARIAARNHPENIRLRLTLRFALPYFALFVAALLLCRTVPVTDLPAIRSILERTMSSPLTGCQTARECIRAILWSARYEGLLLALLLIGGMTLFCESVCGAVLALHGAVCGFWCYGSVKLTAARHISGENLNFFICFFAMWAISSLLLVCATEAVIFSYRYRDIGHVMRRERDALSVRYMLSALTYLGTLTVTVAIRAVLMLLIQSI